MLIIGPPGSGKGTQATRLSALLGVAAVSTGDLFRWNIETGTPLGNEAKKFLDAGEFVPDNVTNSMVRARINQEDTANGFLLDGYPRTLDQARYLDGILAEAGHEIDSVLLLTVDEEELVQRILLRGQSQGRSDDNEAVIRRRLRLYREQTSSVVAKYVERGILSEVSGTGDVGHITNKLMEAASTRHEMAGRDR